MSLLHAKTELLDIVYEDGGVADAPGILLLHAWPNDIRGWRQVAPRLHPAGYRTITPYLHEHRRHRSGLSAGGEVPHPAVLPARLTTPLMIQGGADRCDEPASSEDMEQYFRDPTAGWCSKEWGIFHHAKRLRVWPMN
jgi:pimeloyl-ACP methyl ester carboxylesterase